MMFGCCLKELNWVAKFSMKFKYKTNVRRMKRNQRDESVIEIKRRSSIESAKRMLLVRGAEKTF